MNLQKNPSHPWLLHVFCACLVIGTWMIVPMAHLNVGLPKLLVFAIGAVAGLLWMFFDCERKEETSSPVEKLFWLFFVLVFLSVLWSAAPQLSIVGASPRFEGVFTYGLYASVAVIASAIVRRGQSDLLIRALLISNIGVVLYGLLQVLNIDPLSHVWLSQVFLGRTFSLLGQPNTLGLYLVLTMPFVLLQTKQTSLRKKYAWIAVLLLNFLVLISTVSRGAIIGLAVAVICGLLWFKRCTTKQKTKNEKRKTLLIIALCIFFVGFLLHVTQQRFSHPSEVGRSVSSRAIILEGAWDMVTTWPLGYGLETMGILSGRHMPTELLQYESLTTRIDRAHSQPLDLILSLGVQGAVVFYVLMGMVVLGLWRSVGSGPGAGRATFMSLVGGLVTLLFGFHSVVTGVWFWVVVGIGIGSLRGGDVIGVKTKDTRHKIQDTKKEHFYSLNICFLFLVSCVLLVHTSLWTSSRIAMERAEQWFAEGDLVNAIAAYDHAIERFPYDRYMLVQATETSLMGLENTDDRESQETLHALIDEYLLKLDRLGGHRDGMVHLLSAWQEALRGDGNATDWHLLQAAMHQPNIITNYRIAIHCYKLLDRPDEVQQTRQSLRTILPPEIWDEDSEKGRILRKEHPWVEELSESASS